MKIYGPIEKANFECLAADPSSPATGYFYFNTTSNKFRFWNGTVWKDLETDLSTHASTTATHGVTGAIVGTTDTQTLTNKTIVAASNTITTAASGNLAATDLNAALAELQTDIDTRATSSALTTHTGASTAHGVTGALVGTTDAQALSNKTISTANNTIQSGAAANGTVLTANGSGGTSWLTPGSSITVTSKTTAYTASAADDLILVSAASAAWTLSLPAAATVTGKQFRIKKTDSSANAVTIDPSGSETIDGMTTYPLNGQYNWIVICSDGTGWVKIAAGETVTAVYKSGAGNSLASAGIIDFGTKGFDSHNAVTVGASWKFVAPTPGKYRASWKVFALNLTDFATNGFDLWLRKNGAAYVRAQGFNAGSAGQYSNGGSVTVDLLAGEYLDIYNSVAHSGAALYNNAIDNYVSIERISI